eukprot:2155124-Pleurochrysis_carterae.AAC.2
MMTPTTSSSPNQTPSSCAPCDRPRAAGRDPPPPTRPSRTTHSPPRTEPAAAPKGPIVSPCPAPSSPPAHRAQRPRARHHHVIRHRSSSTARSAAYDVLRERPPRPRLHHVVISVGAAQDFCSPARRSAPHHHACDGAG